MCHISSDTVLRLQNPRSQTAPLAGLVFNSICGSSVCDGAIVLSPRLSFDEGRNWDKYSFTSSPLYVDGVLGEPGEDTLIMT